jgi:hypothetical protein
LLILYFNFFSNVKTTDGTNIGPSDTGIETIISETTLSNTDQTPKGSDTNTNINKEPDSPTNSDNPLPNTASLPNDSETNSKSTDPSTMDLETNKQNTPIDSDITLSTIDPSNATLSTDPIISIRPRIVLLGFGLFQRPIRSLVTFKVYFKRFLVIVSTKFMHFTVVTNYLRRLRVLEEQTANCNLITDPRDDDMTYNCTVPVDANKEFTMSAKDDFVFEGLNPELIISSYANNTMKSLSSQTDDLFENGVLILNNSILTYNDNSFTIEGYLIEGELNDKQIILSFDENGDGNLVNATCNVNNKGNQIYELVCSSNRKIKAPLEGVMGKTSGKPLLILMAEGNNNLDYDPTFLNHIYSKKSSNGLSSGAIAGIVIACCVALIAAIVAAYLCRRQAKPPIPEVSPIEMNSTNSFKY